MPKEVIYRLGMPTYGELVSRTKADAETIEHLQEQVKLEAALADHQAKGVHSLAKRVKTLEARSEAEKERTAWYIAEYEGLSANAIKRIKELEARIEADAKAIEAAEALDARLEVVHNDYRFHGVWVLAGQHLGPYSGPTYERELAELRAALAERGE